jgi:hypothetical protein
MDRECTCDNDERGVVENVARQRDYCNRCGYPNPETRGTEGAEGR